MSEIKPHIVKKSVSLSAVVAQWAEELAAAKGFDLNFSAYVADLIRRDREREDGLPLARQTKRSPHHH